LKRKTDKCWHLPKTIQLDDLRGNSRLSFSNRMYTAEIIHERGSVYGYAIDVNPSFLAIEADTTDHLTIGDKTQVLIRLINSNSDVFYREAIVSKIIAPDSSAGKVILRLFEKNRDTHERKSDRTVVENTSIKLEGIPFSDDQRDYKALILNISNAGMTVQFGSTQDCKNLISGLILNSLDPSLHFIIIWISENIMGLKPIIDSPPCLVQWYRFINSVSSHGDSAASVRQKQLAELLTHSGLLKGSRRTPFGRKISDHVVSTRVESPLLAIRNVILSHTGEPICHLTGRRVSEKSWCLTDGATTSPDPEAYERVFKMVIRSMVGFAHLSHKFPRYFCSVLHHSIKSSDRLLTQLAVNSRHFLLPAWQLSIRGFLAKPSYAVRTPVLDLCLLDADRRRAISSAFSPTIFEAITGNDGTHSVLNSELSKLGPYHRVVTKVLEAKGAVAIAHRIVTHGSWSTTGVTNSVFLLIPAITGQAELDIFLYSVVNDGIALGTDDVLIIVDGPADFSDQLTSFIPNSKRFCVHLHDLLNNETDKYHDPKMF
ncbi:MAG: hypothetical protein NTV34_11945, partial [Proteobacteria bacterium]|nr:hypothetical protein [Pseudomonadota bacterium]